MRPSRPIAVALTALYVFAPSPSGLAGAAVAQVATQCVNARSTSTTAFFKARITNGCNRTIWVSYCENRECGRTSRYYTSAATLSPGESAAVDTTGGGIEWAACVYEAPEYLTPSVTTPGRFQCD